METRHTEPAAASSRTARVVRFLFEPPPGVRPEAVRTFVLLTVGTLAATVLHLAYVFIFLGLGATGMAQLNLVSIPTYLLAFLLNRRGRHAAALAIAVIELCVHQVCAVYSIGWAAGLQYYLLVAPACAATLPGRRLAVKVWITLPALATFLFLLANSDIVPAHAVDLTVLLVLGAINVASVFGLLGLFVYHYAGAAEVAEARLQQEFARAESLLHNILPVSIADRLKRSGNLIADGFADASVLFADIVGFTDLSARMEPARVVAILNEVFSALDAAVERSGLEKIKTIGDAYMVAAGIPEPRADHAEAVADLALEIVTIARETGDRLGIPLRMRVGINSGPVVAGVIGQRKFLYDLWGDSVNVAARMESSGVADRIQVSEEAHARLADRFVFEPRGEIVIKGKGTMRTWFLIGRKDVAA